jgi:hypothetical protein
VLSCIPRRGAHLKPPQAQHADGYKEKPQVSREEPSPTRLRASRRDDLSYRDPRHKQGKSRLSAKASRAQKARLVATPLGMTPRRDPSLTLDFVEREKRIRSVAFSREKDDSVRRTAQMPG